MRASPFLFSKDCLLLSYVLFFSLTRCYFLFAVCQPGKSIIFFQRLPPFLSSFQLILWFFFQFLSILIYDFLPNTPASRFCLLLLLTYLALGSIAVASYHRFELNLSLSLIIFIYLYLSLSLLTFILITASAPSTPSTTASHSSPPSG